MAEYNEALGFDYVDLNEIDPSFKPVPATLYQLQIISAGLKDFTYKKTSVNKQGEVTHQAGDTGSYISFQFAITNNEDHAGRRIFESLFFGPRELRTLRKLMDVTGVQQQPGTPLSEWLKQLSEVRPEFRVPVDVVEDKRGVPDPVTGVLPQKNVVRWKELMPVGA